MDIPQSQTPKSLITLSSNKVNHLKLKLNQTIEVKVISSKQDNNSVEIKLPLDNKSLQVQGSIPLKNLTGKILELLVTKATIPIEFKVLSKQTDTKNILLKQLILPNNLQKKPATSKPTALALNTLNSLSEKPVSNTSTVQQTIINATNQATQIQGLSPALLNQVITGFPQINSNKSISDTLKQLAQQILNNLPDKKKLQDPKQLKRLITNSGLFLEAKLAKSGSQANQSLQNDFKTQLLKLHQALKQASNPNLNPKISSETMLLLKEMQQKTESALAKTTLNQLASLPKDEGNKQIWVSDLAFLEQNKADSVRIEINRKEKNTDKEEEENWVVDITITPPGLTTIHCKISCYDKTINTQFWSTEQQLVTTINNQLDHLKRQFENVGIKPGHMSAHTGTEKTEVQQLQGINQERFNQKV